MQTILSITYVTTIFNHTSPFLTWVNCYARVCKSYLANGTLKQPCCQIKTCCPVWDMWLVIVGVNKSRTLPKKRTVIFCSSTRRWGVQSRYISSRTNKLMTVIFLLSLSDNCCFYKRLSPGRSKTYVTFDITKDSCTWSLTVSNVCDYWHFQSLVESKCVALILTFIIMSTVTYWEESCTFLVKHHIRTIHPLFYSVICFHLHVWSPRSAHYWQHYYIKTNNISKVS